MHLTTDSDQNANANPSPTPEEQEMNKTLQEALSCTTCTPTPAKPAFYADLAAGIYNPTRDPPFTRHHQKSDDAVSPLEAVPVYMEPGYGCLVTEAQRERYWELVAREREDEVDMGMGLEDENEDAELYARYKVDYHIHHHYLARCGVLTLCRNVEEMHELRKWRWRLDAVDGRGETRKGLKMRRWGWPGDENRSMMLQTALWRRRWRGRQERVEEAGIKWMGIMEERRKQREKMRVKVKVRVYCWKNGGEESGEGGGNGSF
ncbi:hypothetical protein AWENTII_003476 [Aspergillus wentii]